MKTTKQEIASKMKSIYDNCIDLNKNSHSAIWFAVVNTAYEINDFRQWLKSKNCEPTDLTQPKAKIIYNNFIKYLN